MSVKTGQSQDQQQQSKKSLHQHKRTSTASSLLQQEGETWIVVEGTSAGNSSAASNLRAVLRRRDDLSSASVDGFFANLDTRVAVRITTDAAELLFPAAVREAQAKLQGPDLILSSLFLSLDTCLIVLSVFLLLWHVVM